MKLQSFVSPLVALVLAGGSSAQSPPPLAPLPKIGKEPVAPANAVTPAHPAGDAMHLTASAAPADVVASAVAAVNNLGKEVVLGHYQVALERMNPQWKDRTAKRMKGGIEEMEKELAGVAKQMVQQGISMISFKTQGQPRSYEVGLPVIRKPGEAAPQGHEAGPGKKIEKVDGVGGENLVFTKWLIMIPTVTQFRVMQKMEGKAPKVITIESIGFQVAISDKGKNDWSFIDGSGLTINDLRGLFVNLPQNLQFPPLEKREAR